MRASPEHHFVRNPAPVFETQYRLLGPTLLLIAVTLTAACGGTPDDVRAARGIRVVTSTSILADLVRQVGGEHVQAQALVPAGADVHTFTLSPKDVVAVVEARLVVTVGAGLEAGIDGIVRTNAGGRLLVLADQLALHGTPRDPAPARAASAPAPRVEGRVDPHFWMDVDLTEAAVAAIRDALIAADPGHAGAYRDRAASYSAQLRDVDAEIRALLAALPAPRRILVTFHDAYGYFAQRYDLTLLGFVVEGPESEPSAGELAALVGAMRDADVPFIFREPEFSARVVQEVARGAGAEVRTIPSASLTDAYPTYIDYLKAIAHALAQ